MMYITSIDWNCADGQKIFNKFPDIPIFLPTQPPKRKAVGEKQIMKIRNFTENYEKCTGFFGNFP